MEGYFWSSESGRNFVLALSNVRSLAEDGIMDRMPTIRMGSS
jgi:hypothetical protein